MWNQLEACSWVKIIIIRSKLNNWMNTIRTHEELNKNLKNLIEIWIGELRNLGAQWMNETHCWHPTYLSNQSLKSMDE